MTRRASRCACGLVWLPDWRNSRLETAIQHTRDHCFAVNFTV